MTIRRAAEGDIPGLVRLLRQVGRVHHEGRPDLFRPDAQKYSAKELQAMLPDDGRPIFVAVDEQEDVRGYAFCILRDTVGDRVLTDRKTLYIDDLCVDETRRKQGVGGALYRFVCAFARESGCYNVTLNVWACNRDALAFYERCGLTPQKIGMEHIL